MRLLLLAALVAAPLGLATAATAGPCGPEGPCPPCPYTLVIDGKNTRLERAQC
jgi:hypothetical protein